MREMIVTALTDSNNLTVITKLNHSLDNFCCIFVLGAKNNILLQVTGVVHSLWSIITV